MKDILERLRGYNPVDRTITEQRQIAVDIHDAATEIERLRAEIDGANAQFRNINQALNEGDGTYRP